VKARWRTLVARLLTVVGVLLIVVSIAANFVERQALDRGEVEDTARQLITDDAIQREIAATLTDSLFANVDVEAALEERLPPQQQGLAGPLAGALQPVAERIALRILDRPRFQELWVTAVGGAQAQVVRVLDDEAVFIETEGGIVSLDLRPLLVELTGQLPIAPDLSERLPEDAGVITLFEAEQLETAQDLTRLLRVVADWIWVLALLAWAGAVFVARDRRKEVRAIALGLIVVGFLLLVLRTLAGSYLVDELAPTESLEEAVGNAWDIVTRLLRDGGWAAITLGIVALLGVWLSGPTASGTAARRWLAPVLVRPATTYLVLWVLWVLFIWWGPFVQARDPVYLVVSGVLLVVGVELLRRQAIREFPDAAEIEPRELLRFGRSRGSTQQLDELERLARLREQGVIDDAELQAAKARLQGPG
jgi:hypothetical protein